MKITHRIAFFVLLGIGLVIVSADCAKASIADSLRITEIMYHPLDTNEPNETDTEFIELKNIGTKAINLNGVQFNDGVDFTFGDESLDPNAYILVVQNLADFQNLYGTDFNIAGEYDGSLNNGGEAIILTDPTGNLNIHNFAYSDGWFSLTDGEGFSLTLRPEALSDPNVNDTYNRKSAWRPSSYIGGSPGAEDPGIAPAPGSIVINELLSHSHADSDWIELYNTTDEEIDISGWFLSDDPNMPKMYEIAEGTIIDANDYIVFYETEHFGNTDDPGTRQKFGLSEDGETLYLRSADNGELTGFATQEKFGFSITGVSMGRYQKSTGAFNFVPLQVPTPGAANADPIVGPVVISEIMYHPEDNGDAEYVELANINDYLVVLYSTDANKGWRFTDNPDDPTIDVIFTDPRPNRYIELAAHERLVLVKDAVVFANTYSIPAGVQVIEWGDGKLGNGGEKIQLSRPERDEQDQLQWIRVDRVNYSDGSHHDDFDAGQDPWPVEADGQGSALHRIDLDQYGNDPINWTAGPPSPGQ